MTLEKVPRQKQAPLLRETNLIQTCMKFCACQYWRLCPLIGVYKISCKAFSQSILVQEVRLPDFVLVRTISGRAPFNEVAYFHQ